MARRPPIDRRAASADRKRDARRRTGLGPAAAAIPPSPGICTAWPASLTGGPARRGLGPFVPACRDDFRLSTSRAALLSTAGLGARPRSARASDHGCSPCRGRFEPYRLCRRRSPASAPRDVRCARRGQGRLLLQRRDHDAGAPGYFRFFVAGGAAGVTGRTASAWGGGVVAGFGCFGLRSSRWLRRFSLVMTSSGRSGSLCHPAASIASTEARGAALDQLTVPGRPLDRRRPTLRRRRAGGRDPRRA